MKKMLLYMMAALLAAPANAQETKLPGRERSFFSFSAGIAVPIICYASSDVNNNTSGFARLGFSLDIQYAYRFSDHAGVTGSVYYCSNKAGSTAVKAVSSPGSYRLVGCMAGPFISTNFGNRWDADFKAVAGVAKLFTPKLQYGEDILLNKESAACFAWGGGLALRYGLSDRTFLQLKTDHLNMKPQFSRGPGEPGKTEQHIVVMNVDAGIGWKF